MTGVISLFFVLLIWRFLIVLGETVFAAAGLPPSVAKFEARSALVGAGYTTSNSELVVADPVARRVASALIIFGYFGPAAILALLGFSFVVPTGESLRTRAITLVVLLFVLFVIDRIGIIRVLGTRPARTIARRLMSGFAFESWIVVGDHVIVATPIPHDLDRAARVLRALNEPTVKILAIEPADHGQPTFPSASESARPQPGERVVAFGPVQVFDELQAAST